MIAVFGFVQEDQIHVFKRNDVYTYTHTHTYIVYVIESAAYGVIFTSCLCQSPNERGTNE